MQFLLSRTPARSDRTRSLACAALLGAAAVALGAPAVAAADPAPEQTPEAIAAFTVPTADAPVPVSGGEFGWVATHAITKQLAGMNAPEAIATLPVPAQYKPANLGLAQQFDLALTGALASPGGCLQVVIDPRSTSGNLFNYGFFPVAGEYCS
ncbi:hypothetical protein [Gordonia paraffinivorans]|uniref:Uncharacterized protein n=2 Tax=Gordonia paraffinivorans TaxID=175628 RepID=A0ABQ0IFA8_9ACTN|nr:hypothetical protein [Gordonia paraffinivorans]MBY4572126.1 hypothetical protein [Gordonia paraffinivorans]MCD2144186.1 hypothetical protein [Gordonia paraffinivorans]PWD43960.1 hypothetical protein ACN93_05750 [Gordonia paraffinivorans]VFA82623.1 Uncharacterised protein [Gordonia paraffinivorans]GAC82246.1 hypothetical protein GP2_001_00990 [Gordonia paraffinivorans NBRC 108238]